MKRLGTAIAFLFLYGMSCAQGLSTEGNDFWVGFLSNYRCRVDTLSLLATGNVSTTGRVSTASGSWSDTFNVIPGQVTTVLIPDSLLPTLDEMVANAGLHVTTGASISLYASNYGRHTYDNTNVLPTASLRNRYIIQTSSSIASSWRNEFCVVATTDSTVVYINTTANSDRDRFQAGVTDSVVLQRGQFYMVKSFEDLSGTEVWTKDCKPVAVFMGNECAAVPDGCEYCDHLYEQAIPTEYWGRHFGITSSRTRLNDVLMITARYDSTLVSFGGTTLWLNARESVDTLLNYSVTDRAFYLESSKPVSVYLYLTGTSCGGSKGDPSFTVIHPLEEQLSSIVFSTYSTSVVDSHYVNIVTRSSNYNHIYIDSHWVNPYAFLPLPGNEEYVYAQVRVSHGSHRLCSNQGGFVAHVYGLGVAESYSYAVGSCLDPINPQAFLNGQPFSAYHSPNNSFCLDDTFHFRAEVVNIESTVVTWIFGDGNELVGPSVSYRYEEPGDYTVIVHFSYVDGCSHDTNYVLTLPVRVLPQAISFTDTMVCDSLCFWNGEYYDTPGLYNVIFPSTEPGVCDSVAKLNIKAIYVPPEPLLDYEYDCESQQCILHAHGGGDYLRWHSIPSNPMLDSCLGDSVVRAATSDAYTYYLYMAYGFDTLCGAEISMDVPAIQVPIAKILASTNYVDYLNTGVILSDKSVYAVGRVWYADGMEIGTDSVVDYSYPLSHYSVTIVLDAYNDYDCHDLDSLVLYLDPSIEDIYLPNVITPGLSQNRQFRVFGKRLLDGEIWIYDREGRQVWYTNNIFDSWDGTKDGIKLPTGAYVFTIRYRFSFSPDVWFRKTGTVLVVR